MSPTTTAREHAPKNQQSHAWWAGTLYYVAAPGETNKLTVAETSGSYVFSDPNATVNAQFGCKAIDAHSASCEGKHVKSLYLKTSDANDTISFQPATIAAAIDCGSGTDALNTPDPNTKPVNCEYINAPAGPVNPPTVVPPPAPVSIVQPVATMTRAGSVPVTLSCSANASERCTGTLTFELPQSMRTRQVAASRRGAPNILGRTKVTVGKGKKRKVKISMSGKGRSMVNRRKKLKVTAKLKIKQGGITTTSKQSLTIRASRR